MTGKEHEAQAIKLELQLQMHFHARGKDIDGALHKRTLAKVLAAVK